MNFLDLCTKRYSVRTYSDAPVSEADLNYILQCARLAPSAVNFQPWRFIIVQSDAMRLKLQTCYHREWFNEAPLYIICVVRHNEAWVRKSDQKAHGNIDIAIAAEHICLAAADKGLGSCWVCNFDAALCHKLFTLEDNEEAAVLIPIGHPSAPDATPEKSRKELETLISFR